MSLFTAWRPRRFIAAISIVAIAASTLATRSSAAQTKSREDKGVSAGQCPPDITSFFARMDAFDYDAFLPRFAETATLRFGNTPPRRGAAAIAHMFRVESKGAFKAMRHDIAGCWTRDGSVVVESMVTYWPQAGGEVTVPAVTILRLAPDRRIADMRIFIDPTPLMSPAPASSPAR